MDVFITGESRHDNYHFAKEKKLNVIYSGHYATETVGINALKDLIKDKFDILTVFIDIPTSL